MKCNYNGCSSKCKGDIDAESCNVLRAYQQGRADREKELSELPNEYSEKLWKIAYQKGKTNGAREFAEWFAECEKVSEPIKEYTINRWLEDFAKWQKGN